LLIKVFTYVFRSAGEKILPRNSEKKVWGEWNIMRANLTCRGVGGPGDQGLFRLGESKPKRNTAGEQALEGRKRGEGDGVPCEKKKKLRTRGEVEQKLAQNQQIKAHLGVARGRKGNSGYESGSHREIVKTVRTYLSRVWRD